MADKDDHCGPRTSKWVELYEPGQTAEAYPLVKEEAASECPPGLAALFLGAMETERTRDRMHVDRAVASVRGNLREDFVLQVAGAALHDIGIVEEGLALLRRAVELSSSDKNLRVFASRLEKHHEHVRETMHLYSLLLDRDMDDVSAIVGYACSLEILGNLDCAEPMFRRAISLCPTHATAHYELGNLLADRGALQEALPYYHRAIELKHWRLETAWAGVSYCLLKLGRSDEARTAALKSLEVKPDYKYAQEIVEELDQADAKKASGGPAGA